MNDVDIAYIAGLFDGEGSINIKRGVEKKKNHKKPGYRMSNSMRISMEVTMTDRSVLIWLHEVLGVGTLRPKKVKGKRVDARTEGCCYVTMQTNAGPLTVYIDSMDGLDDAPLVNAWIPYRKERVMIMGGRNYKLKPNHPMFIK